MDFDALPHGGIVHVQPRLLVKGKQETAKDGMAGLQSGNKIWEDSLRTSLKAMVNLRYCMTLKFEWTKVTKVPTKFEKIHLEQT